jgi:pimeloyl-ACP methyl ester carboxylesterase
MPYFDRDGLRFHYLDRPVGTSALPFFFQHGLGSESERVFALIDPPLGFRLLGMDCRGHGQTVPLGDLDKLSFGSFADDLVALMDHLQIPQGIVGGTSVGAGVALNCALRYPTRVLGLVLLRPAWLDGPMPDNARIFRLIAQLIRAHGPSRAAAIFKDSPAYGSMLTESPDSANSLLDLFSHPRAAETIAKLERISQDAPSLDRAQWRGIAVPTLVLANRQDPIHPFEYGTILAREIPKAHFVELTPKSVSLAQYTSDLNRALRNFLKQHFAPVPPRPPSLTPPR